MAMGKVPEKPKHQESDRDKAHSQISMNKKSRPSNAKKNPLNDSSCYGSSNRFKKPTGKAGKKHQKYSKKKDTSLPPPIKNREFEGCVLPNSNGKGRNYQQNNQLFSQYKNEYSKPNLFSEQEILSYVFSSRNGINNINTRKPLWYG